MTKKELAKADRAHELDKQLRSLTVMATEAFYRMGQIMKEIRDNQYFEVLDFDSFEAYFAQPELGFKKSSVYHAIKLVETFPAYKEIADVSYGKLLMIAPHITESNKLDLIGKARSLSRSDLITEIRDLRGGGEPDVTRVYRELWLCPKCGRIKGIKVYEICRCKT